MDEDVEYGLVVQFTDESASFVHGFEAGGIWCQLKDNSETFTVTTHFENREVLQSMARAEKWTAKITPSEVEGWDYVEFTKNPTKPMLRVVS